MAFSQDSTVLDKVHDYSDKFFNALDNKAKDLNQKLDKQTTKYLNRMEKQEERLKKQVAKKDSLLAGKLFTGIQDRYQKLKNTAGKLEKYQNLYSGHLDSLTTSLNFLKTSKLTDLTKSNEIDNVLNQYKQFQEKLNATNKIKKYLEDRETFLKEQLKNFSGLKEYRKFKEQVYYYQAQVKEYKQEFEDPSKIEKKLLSLVRNMPQFQSFFAKYSQLASLFALDSGPDVSNTQVLAGLQTRTQINQTISSRSGTASFNPNQQLQQSGSMMQGQLNDLKNKVNSYTSGNYNNNNGSDIKQPDFKPNSQKVKSFLKRIQLGTNLQTQRANSFFPMTSDIGISIGYKLNDKSIIGIGGSYKIGWGSGWNNVRITHQGVGLRSFVDYQLKGSLYLSGGYEQNYKNEIKSLSLLRNYSAWQSSGLIGLSKKYHAFKKLNGDIKLLWDFLSYQQIPKAQPILFRIGYSFK